MNGWSELDRFLRTDPRDVGCAQAMEMLHVYAELVAADAPAEERYPGIAAHLRACAAAIGAIAATRARRRGACRAGSARCGAYGPRARARRARFHGTPSMCIH